VFATNTSSLAVIDQAASTTRPTQFVGLHYFNPAQVMKLVEVIRAVTTSDEAFATAHGFAQAQGKLAIPTKDKAGFIVNRLLVPYMLDAMRAYEEGVGSVDESAITGESAPVIRESGGDRSAVTGGTTVLSDRIVVHITSKPGETFIDRMIALVEGAKRQKTPNEIALNILLASLTIIFMLAVISLQPMAFYSKAPQSLVILVALLVALIPTTIGALLSAIGIAGMDRLVQRNVLAVSGRAVEAAGDVNTLLLDKTGTITIGNRQATEFLPVNGVTAEELVVAVDRSAAAARRPLRVTAVTGHPLDHPIGFPEGAYLKAVFASVP